MSPLDLPGDREAVIAELSLVLSYLPPHAPHTATTVRILRELLDALEGDAPPGREETARILQGQADTLKTKDFVATHHLGRIAQRAVGAEPDLAH